MTQAYKEAGVDIDAGDRLVKRIAPLARTTARPGADAALGGFGGLFDLKAAGYENPVLVCGTDGVGTKVKLAVQTGIHNTVGIDLVAMCVNDVLAQGAEPLLFLDYFATGRLDVDITASVVEGIAEGCRRAGCALIGGETAEMHDVYSGGDYDMAGFCVGAVETGCLLPRKVSAGDMMIGLESSGAHANGFSLIRKIVSGAQLDYDMPAPFSPDISLGAALLEPTRIYTGAVLPLLKDPRVKAFAHITGGGLTDNVPRVLGDSLAPRYDSLPLPPLFGWLQETGKLDTADMHRTFNCGTGGVMICSPEAVDDITGSLHASGQPASVIGDITER